MKLLLATLILFITINSIAQQKVALHHNGITTIFSGSNPFNDAYVAAQSGDTIYLPGGNIPFPTVLDKGLVIFGAGHFPDSTLATYKTVLNGSFTIQENADNLHIEGLDITGAITFGTNHQVDNVIIKRCRVGSIVYNGTGATPCINNEIIENVIIGSNNFQNLRSSIVANCIFQERISNGVEIGVSNNIFLYNPNSVAYPINNLDNSYISNNIFLRSGPYSDYIHSGCDLSTFSYNIFANNPGSGNNILENNFLTVDVTTLFVNQTGNSFNYAHDYHLINPSVYLGTDGFQVGIYGGLFPFKAGSVPVNPHFQTKIIAPQTDSNGDLQIQIQVEAQQD
jgi:hypothetical protein